MLFSKFLRALLTGLLFILSVSSIVVIWEVRQRLEVTGDLRDPLTWIQGPFRTPDPEHPRIGYFVGKNFLGDYEQAVRWKSAIQARGGDVYFFNLLPDDNFWVTLAHQVVLFFLKPDFVFTPFSNPRPRSPYAYASTWSGSFEPKESFLKDYDGYLHSRADDLWFEKALAQHKREVPLDYAPVSANKSLFPPAEPRKVFYCGGVWDKKRRVSYKAILSKLSEADQIDIYGPPALAVYGSAYKGFIPFDGHSLVKKIHEAGIALCLHSTDHNKAGMPTARVFEAAAAGAVIISDQNPFIKKYFGDSILYIDTSTSVNNIYTQIKDHLTWIHEHPQEAQALAARAQKIFLENFTVEAGLEKLLQMHKDVVCQREGRCGLQDG